MCSYFLMAVVKRPGELCVVRIHGNSYRPRNSHMSEDPQTNQRECINSAKERGDKTVQIPQGYNETASRSH